jgi:CRISP-associated protein Cas1
MQGLDPYYGCLHQPSDKHPALVSDLIEEFRTPIVDSLVLMMINQHSIDPSDFVLRDGGCYLNLSGSKKYLKAFLARMKTEVDANDAEKQPKWDSIIRQVRAYKQFIDRHSEIYQPYQIR